MKFRLSNHTKEEMQCRGIPLDFVEFVLNSPQQIIKEKGNKKAYQSQIDFGDGRIFLLWVIVAEEVDPAFVVKVCRTSKINKYWRRV